jgi:hypothetical protein
MKKYFIIYITELLFSNNSKQDNIQKIVYLDIGSYSSVYLVDLKSDKKYVIKFTEIKNNKYEKAHKDFNNNSYKYRNVFNKHISLNALICCISLNNIKCKDENNNEEECNIFSSKEDNNINYNDVIFKYKECMK